MKKYVVTLCFLIASFVIIYCWVRCCVNDESQVSVFVFENSMEQRGLTSLSNSLSLDICSEGKNIPATIIAERNQENISLSLESEEQSWDLILAETPTPLFYSLDYSVCEDLIVCSVFFKASRTMNPGEFISILPRTPHGKEMLFSYRAFCNPHYSGPEYRKVFSVAVRLKSGEILDVGLNDNLLINRVCTQSFYAEHNSKNEITVYSKDPEDKGDDEKSIEVQHKLRCDGFLLLIGHHEVGCEKLILFLEFDGELFHQDVLIGKLSDEEVSIFNAPHLNCLAILCLSKHEPTIIWKVLISPVTTFLSSDADTFHSHVNMSNALSVIVDHHNALRYRVNDSPDFLIGGGISWFNKGGYLLLDISSDIGELTHVSKLARGWIWSINEAMHLPDNKLYFQMHNRDSQINDRRFTEEKDMACILRLHNPKSFATH